MAKRTAPPLDQSGLTPEISSVITSPSHPATPGTSVSAAAAPSLRITRSAARLAAESPLINSHLDSPNPSAPPQSRKRKVPVRRDKASDDPELHLADSTPRRAKRLKLAGPSVDPPAPLPHRRGARPSPAMSQPGPSSRPLDDSTRTPASSPSVPRQKSSINRKSSQDAPSTSPPRRQKKRLAKRDSDIMMKESEINQRDTTNKDKMETSVPSDNSNNHNDVPNPPSLDEDDGDPFRSSLFGARSPLGLHNTLRTLSGMMSGMSSRLRDILANLKMKDDPSIQLIALQELSDLLLVSNEDNLAGQFSPDPYVKELVTLMQPSEAGEENPEIMLLACRSLANLMEALRGSVANVVYGGAVPILCQKLLDIQFIDLAEQALSTLSKISVDFPASIVREGGLTACLSYLDFFPTSTQRTAVTTAANCCRNLPHDSFPVIREVMPTLLNVLCSNDQKVVEQGCLCVSRVVESFKYKPEKLEELIEPAMLKAVLRLLLPGTTNLIGPHIHTQFLRVLAITAKSSPRLSVELLKMNVVDTLYQILTGVSPPAEIGDDPIKIDSVHIMQALIHLPREQVFETLNVICELLPGIPGDALFVSDDHLPATVEGEIFPTFRSAKAKASACQRLELLKECKPEIKRFAMILFPTLTDTYSSTVNLGVRQKVLIAQLKMLQTLDVQIIEDALRSVPYASFLAAILSQKDHLSLVALALQCAELLFERLENIYQYQFHREGVITEITKLAETPVSTNITEGDPMDLDMETGNGDSSDSGGDSSENDEEKDESNERHDDESADDEDDNEDDHGDDDDVSESDSSSSISGNPLSQTLGSAIQDLVTHSAKEFLQIYEGSKGRGMHDKALKILHGLQQLVAEIKDYYINDGGGSGLTHFQKLASYFDGDALESITSSELLNSGIIHVLLDVVGHAQDSKNDAKTDFLQAFMGSRVLTDMKGNVTPTTAFSVLIHKLHDLLSRTEHFEVITVNHSSLDNRNTASMLAKQLRLRLVADEESEIPKPYKNMMVSIHAIANFKALDDYLRPRISLSERPRGSRHRDGTFSQLPSSARLRDTPGSSSDPSSAGSVDPPPPPAISHPNPNTAARSARVADRSKPPPPPSSSQPAPPGSSQEWALRTRRSNRLQQPSPGDETDETDEPLECADERHLTDDDEGEDEEDTLDAIVDDLSDDLSDDGVADPTAVNMEIASTGKVTARKEDGTRVATPQQSASSSRPLFSPPNSFGSSLALAGRPFSSYAAAIASIPQDWHIEFRIDGKPIPSDTTIYRAIHRNREHIGDSPSRNVWSMVHTISYRRVPGPSPTGPSIVTAALTDIVNTDPLDMPESLRQNPTTASILRLLSILHDINANLADILDETKSTTSINPEPLAQFINTKLTAKLNRQLEEPLIVASSCLPSWSEDLARHFPFLFPFETRHLFLQSTSFGYSRSMMRWQASQSADDNRRDQRRDDRPFVGRLQRQKVRISRSRILDSALKVMELYGSSPSVLEVEYFEEVGTGLGPTLEFYSTVSKEFSKKKLKLWRDHDSNEDDDYVFNKLGLFPAPMSREQATQESGKKQLLYFKSLGKFVARSMLDSRIIDISFNPIFFRIGNGSQSITPSIRTVKSVDPDLARSLAVVKEFSNAKIAIEEDPSLSAIQKTHALYHFDIDGVRIEDLGLDFTLPGYPAIELVPHGSSISVTMDNVSSYIDKVIDLTMGSGVRRQIDAFRTGFSLVFPYSSLKAFTSSELVMLFGQVEEDWSIETLMDSIKADHGFNMDSRSVRNLLQTMSEFTIQQRRDFLQFVTGSPKLPIGGFKSLTPMFTVVCRPSEPPYTSDDYLPSVMTCVNYLKLPDYSDLATLRERLDVAIREGQGAFHLS